MASRARRRPPQTPKIDTKYMSSAIARVAHKAGGFHEYRVFYDRRTGMPHPFHVRVTAPTGDHLVEVYDCTPLKEVARVIGTAAKVNPGRVGFFLNGQKLCGPTTKIGELGVFPDCVLEMRLSRTGKLSPEYVNEGATRSHKLRGPEASPGPEQPSESPTAGRRRSVWDGMLSKRSSVGEGTQPIRKRTKPTPLMHTAHVYSCYDNPAPISPTTQCQLYKLEPPKKPEVQIEFGDAGLYYRHEHTWQPKPFGKAERRFSYSYENPGSGRNRHGMIRVPSTRPWESPWKHHICDQSKIWLDGGLVPPYSSLRDPHCAHFARRLYGKAPPPDKKVKESLHDFYKRREEEASNSFQRARRRSIELIEQVQGKLNAQTVTSRRKSVCDYTCDTGMDHLAAAREATRLHNEKTAQLYRAKTPCPQEFGNTI